MWHTWKRLSLQRLEAGLGRAGAAGRVAEQDHAVWRAAAQSALQPTAGTHKCAWHGRRKAGQGACLGIQGPRGRGWSGGCEGHGAQLARPAQQAKPCTFCLHLLHTCTGPMQHYEPGPALTTRALLFSGAPEPVLLLAGVPCAAAPSLAAPLRRCLGVWSAAARRCTPAVGPPRAHT
jgi:hypothetical protein